MSAGTTTGGRQYPHAECGDGVLILTMATVRKVLKMLKVLNVWRTREDAHLWLLGNWAHAAIRMTRDASRRRPAPPCRHLEGPQPVDPR